MRQLSCIVLGALAAALPSQATGVNDVGLTLSGGVLTVIYGQTCGPLACAPFPGGTIALGETRTVTHWAAPTTPYVLAIGFPGPCIQFPGVANSLLLGFPIETLAIGTVQLASSISACRQGAARYTLVMPPAGPTGIMFRLQSLGVGNSGALAFGPAIEVTLL